MPREIKFRGWDNKEKIMKNIYTCDYDLDKSYSDFNLGLGEDIAVMQFTGLHDKNGKKIYEGDIIKGKFNSEQEETVDVFWGDGVWALDSKASCDYIFDSDLAKNYEIIGNIYENPELLIGSSHAFDSK